MAIDTKVNVQDSMTEQLLKMADSINMIITAFDKMNNIDVEVNTSGIDKAKVSADDARKSLEALNNTTITPNVNLVDKVVTPTVAQPDMTASSPKIDTTSLENARKLAQEASAALQQMGTANMNGATSSINNMNQALNNTEKEIKDNTNAEDKLTDAVQKTTQSAENMKSSFSGIGATIMGLSLVQNAIGMVKGQMDSAINRMDTMTNYSRTMTAITGDAQAAAQSLNTMKDATKGTAYGLDTAASSVQGFVTRGLTLSQATNQVSSWMDAVAFYGDGTNETLANVTDALGKMLTKGKVEMDQLDRITDAGINAVGIYAQATGRDTASVQADLSKGNISAQEFIGTVSDAFENGKNGVLNIAGAAKEAGGTWATSIANMKAAVTRGVISITESINNSLTANGFPTLIEMVQNFGTIAENVLGNVGNAFGVLINIVSPMANVLIKLGQGIADNWGIIGPIVAGVATSFLILKGATLAMNALEAINAGITGALATAKGIYAIATGTATEATIAETTAQTGLNAALLACPITWIVLAFVALVAIIFAAVDAVNAFTGSSISALGVIAGGVVALGAIIANIGIFLWNALVTIIESIVNFFIIGVTGIQNAWDFTWKTIYNFFVGIAESIVNGWNKACNNIAIFLDKVGIGAGKVWSSIQRGAASAASTLANMFIKGANQAVKAVNWLIKAINKIPGINIDQISEFANVKFNFGADATDKWVSSLENDLSNRQSNGASTVKFDRKSYNQKTANTVDWSGAKGKYFNIADAYQTGYNWGANTQSSISKTINSALNPKTGATNASKLAQNAHDSNLATNASKLAQNAHDSNLANNKTAKNTDKIAQELTATNEDLKYLRDIAERDVINKFTTATIKVSMNNNNNISGGMDIDTFTKHFTSKIEEQMDKVAKGVY
jgi:tape measure domain-containing protein